MSTALADSMPSIYDTICLSTDEAAILAAFPTEIRDIFHSQTDLLIAEVEYDTAAKSAKGQLQVRRRFPVRSLSFVAEQVRLGNPLLSQFARAWKFGIEQRRRLVSNSLDTTA